MVMIPMQMINTSIVVMMTTAATMDAVMMMVMLSGGLANMSVCLRDACFYTELPGKACR